MLISAIIILVVAFFLGFVIWAETDLGGFLAVMFIAALVSLPLMYYGINGIKKVTSEGEHTGFVTAAQKNGLFFTTGRAYIKTDLASSQEDMYCVIDDEVFKKLEELARNKEKVTFQYRGWFENGIENCGGEGEFIYGIK